MKKQKLESIIRDMKKLWALSLAQVDNTSGRRGISMQMEAVEEMCAKRITPQVADLAAEIDAGVSTPAQAEAPTATSPAGMLALPVVEDPSALPARAAAKTNRHGKSARREKAALRLVA